MENGGQTDGKDPSSFLGDIIGNPVTVKLNSGVVYKGEHSRSLHPFRSLETVSGDAWAVWLLTPG